MRHFDMRFLPCEVNIFSEMRRKIIDWTIESDGVRMELQPVEYCPRNTITEENSQPEILRLEIKDYKINYSHIEYFIDNYKCIIRGVIFILLLKQLYDLYYCASSAAAPFLMSQIVAFILLILHLFLCLLCCFYCNFLNDSLKIYNLKMNCAAMAAIDVLIVNMLACIKLMNLAVISIWKSTNGVISTKEVVTCVH